MSQISRLMGMWVRYIYMERRERESRFLILSPFSITKMMIKVYDWVFYIRHSCSTPLLCITPIEPIKQGLGVSQTANWALLRNKCILLVASFFFIFFCTGMARCKKRHICIIFALLSPPKKTTKTSQKMYNAIGDMGWCKWLLKCLLSLYSNISFVIFFYFIFSRIVFTKPFECVLESLLSSKKKLNEKNIKKLFFIVLRRERSRRR